MNNCVSGKGLIFIPTYNEIGNVEKLIQQLDDLDLGLDILFIDDNSPDGTGELLDLLAKKKSNLFICHRQSKMGIGSAHVDGIHWAYQKSYNTLVTMDSDFSHSPAYIVNLLNKSNTADVIVGSRFISKNSLIGWVFIRKFLTRLGHFFTKTLLQMPYDSTGAFRLYRLDHISEELFSIITSGGYSFFFESLFVLYRNNYSIIEIPIDLPSRTYGQSKMTFKDALKSFILLWVIVFKVTFSTGSYKVLGKKNRK